MQKILKEPIQNKSRGDWVNSTTVRRDFSYFGEVGVVEVLADELNEFLCQSSQWQLDYKCRRWVSEIWAVPFYTTCRRNKNENWCLIQMIILTSGPPQMMEFLFMEIKKRSEGNVKTAILTVPSVKAQKSHPSWDLMLVSEFFASPQLPICPQKMWLYNMWT